MRKIIHKGGCSVEVSGSDGNKAFWGVIEDHVFRSKIRMVRLDYEVLF